MHLLALILLAATSAVDAPEISRSPGIPGGVLVFWPRVNPRAMTTPSHDLAAALQARLVDLVRRTLPDRQIDIRPEPERVCGQAGCQSMSVGVLLARNDQVCVLVALVSGPGKSVTTLVPWVGEVRLKQPSVAFREPPESQVAILDYKACDALVAGLGANETHVAAAIRQVAGPP